MDHAEELLQAIIDDPRDIDSRRVYADLLMERRDPLGELIQVQCELDRLDTYDARRSKPEATQAKLLKKHRTRWGRELKKYATAVEFRRGFAEHVSVKAEKINRVAPKLFAMAPIRSIKLCGDREALAEVHRCEQLYRIDQLSVSSMRLGARYGIPLFASPNLENVVSLNISHNGLGVGGLQPLLDCPFLPRLESLNLDDDRLDTPGLEALGESQLLSRLKHLSLNESRVRAAGVAALCRNNRLDKLESLSLRRGFIGNAGITSLCRCDSFRPRYLDLELTHFDGQCIPEMVESGMLERAEFLSVHWNTSIGDEGAKALARASMPALKHINLSRIRMTDEGGEAVLAAPWLDGVRELNIWDNDLGPRSMRALANNPAMKSLITITMQAKSLEAEAIEQLAQTPHVSSLRKIKLPGNLYSSDAWQALADSGNFPDLEL